MNQTTPAQAPEQQGNGKAAAVDVKALIRRPTRPGKTVPIVLGCGELYARWEELDAELQRLARTPVLDKRLGGGDEAKARRVAAEITALEEEMRASEVPFKLRALAEPDWLALCSKHPPRKAKDGSIHERDTMGVNVDAFAEPAIRACVISPELDDEDWRLLFRPTAEEKKAGLGLASGQLDKLFYAVWTINRQTADIPFSSRAFGMTRSSSSK